MPKIDAAEEERQSRSHELDEAGGGEQPGGFAGFPAHMATVPDAVRAPTISVSPLEFDLLGDPALD